MVCELKILNIQNDHDKSSKQTMSKQYSTMKQENLHVRLVYSQLYLVPEGTSLLNTNSDNQRNSTFIVNIHILMRL